MRPFVLAAVVALVMIAGCRKEPFPPVEGIPDSRIRHEMMKRYVGMSVEELHRRHGKPTAIVDDPHRKPTAHIHVYDRGEVGYWFIVQNQKVIEAGYGMDSWSESLSRSQASR